MSKITLSNLANLQNENTAVTALNANNYTLTTAMDNALSRDGSIPNYMNAELDMNSYPIINLPTPTNPSNPLRLQDLIDLANQLASAFPSTGVQPNGTFIYVKNYTNGGTADDTIGVQAALTAALVAGGGTVVFEPNVSYTFTKVDVYSNTHIKGNGALFKQKALGQRMFLTASVTNVTYEGCNFRGFLYPATDDVASASTSFDNFIIDTNSTNYRIIGNTFQYGGATALHLTNTTDYIIEDNLIQYNVAGMQLTGTKRGVVTNNRLFHTCLYSLTPTVNQFTIGISLESTDVDGTASPLNAINTDILITNNIVQDFPYSQGLLMHAGIRVVVSNNIMKNVSIGISANPYNIFDIIENVAIVGNSLTGTSATSLPSSSDAGIVVQGGPGHLGTTPVIGPVTVANNVIETFNRVSSDAGVGGIVIGYTNGVTVTGNTITGCGQNAIVTVSTEEGLAITGNSMNTSVGGAARGIHNTIAVRGLIVGNMIRNMTTGIVSDGGVTNLLRANNQFFGCTTDQTP